MLSLIAGAGTNVDVDDGGDGGDVLLMAGEGFGLNNVTDGGGSVYVSGGDASMALGGSVSIVSGSSNLTSSGDVNIGTSESGPEGSSGSVTMFTGSSSSGSSGGLMLVTGNSTDSAAGDIEMHVGVGAGGDGRSCLAHGQDGTRIDRLQESLSCRWCGPELCGQRSLAPRGAL